MSTAATYQDPGPCLCDDTACLLVGTKLQKPLANESEQHLIGCNCVRHRNKRNKRKGQSGEARAHRALGGTGPTIRDDLFHLYSLNASVEVKTGNQVPARLIDSVRSEFMRHAFAQATKKTPVGTDAFPAVMLQPHGGGQYLVVDCSGKSLR
jgi:hypothetical protein